MASVTYEDVLRDAQQLAPDEQRRLLDEIEARLKVQQPARIVRPDLAADLDAIDEFAAEVSAAWKDNMSAADAVKEQRRDL